LTTRAIANHTHGMPSRLRVVILLLALLLLIDVATPPVIEDHTEIGFCSADCPVQHEGHGIAIAPPLPPRAARDTTVAVLALAVGVDAVLGPVDVPKAPRAPPSA
jgi:hypothetical protein